MWRAAAARLLCCLALSSPALGAGLGDCAASPGRSPAAAGLQVDNDVFGRQDQGYSSGIQLFFTSAAFREEPDVVTGDCHWPATGWLASRLRFLKPQGSQQQKLTASLTHVIYTPTNRESRDPVRNDRPYAAAFLLGLGYNARVDERLQTTVLQLGMVGPSARGEQAQNAIHTVIGDRPFRGWRNQIGDKFVFGVVHERSRRYLPGTGYQPGEWRWDGISHWGASVGNLTTYLNIGGELRFGLRLPDDFGSAPERPAGMHSAYVGSTDVLNPDPVHGGIVGHGFVSVDMRRMFRDLSLDGTSKSHGVSRRPVVGDLGYGIALTQGPWKIVFARFHRSREFEGQQTLPVFGSISISRTF